MRVLLVGDVPPPPGGIAVHVQQWARLLAGRGVTVQVMDTGKGRHHGPGIRPLGGAKGLLKEAAAAFADRSLVHVHVSGNNPKSWALAAAFGRPHDRGRRRILTVHSGLAPAFLARARGNRWLARAVLPGYGAVVAVSQGVRAALTEAGASSGQLHVIPAYLGTGDVPGLLPSAVAELRAKHAPLIAWASHPSQAYGLAHALDALAALRGALPTLGAVVFGPGTGGAAFRSEVTRRCPGVSVIGLGPLPHVEALSVLQAADLSWRPTLVDGDALSVREALALGKRCIASDAAPRPAGAQVYRAGDAGALVRASLEVLARPPTQAGPGSGTGALWSLYQQERERACGG